MRPDAADDDADEKPLDPAIERVQARLRRLILISGTTLGFGFVAVLVAVIFRVSNLDSRAPEADWQSTLEIPAGATLVDTALDGDRIAITIEDSAGRRILVFDLPTGMRIGAATVIPR
jgi:hypothetical protein